MLSQNLTDKERAHIKLVKQLPCSVCDHPGPSSAHHIEQGLHYTVVALCYECHQGRNGWHGTKSMWNIFKMNELKALNVTLRRLLNAKSQSM